MNRKTCARVLTATILFYLTCPATPTGANESGGLNAALEILRSAGPGGNGQARLQTAWRKVASSDRSAIVTILQAMPNSNPLAQNWLRSAVDTIAERTLQSGELLPTVALKEFLLDTSTPPPGQASCLRVAGRSGARANHGTLRPATERPQPGNSLRGCCASDE